MLVNLIELINSYLKPSNTEKRLLGEVFTPLYGKPGCVEDQLNLIDVSFWKRKGVKVLDPCAGIGNYPVVLVDKFMKGLSEEILDPEERLRWILEEIIYINELQSKNLFIYLQLFDSENKYKMNFNRGDYLKLDIKETFGVEKFDLICMNPPYHENNSDNNRNKPLYDRFIRKSIKESSRIISIHPSRWMGKSIGLDDFRKSIFSRKDVKCINHFDDSSILFGKNIDIMGGIQHIFINNEYNGLCKFNGVECELDKFDFFVNPRFHNLLNKFINYKSLSNICESSSLFMNFDSKNLDTIKLDDNTLCYVSQKKGFKKYIKLKDISKKGIDYIGKFKVFTPFANGRKPNFGNKFVGMPGEICSNTYMSLIVESELHGRYLISYMTTKFCNFFLSLRKNTQNMNPTTLKWIPLVPFDREWTDELLFDYFNLTQEERNIILCI